MSAMSINDRVFKRREGGTELNNRAMDVMFSRYFLLLTLYIYGLVVSNLLFCYSVLLCGGGSSYVRQTK